MKTKLKKLSKRTISIVLTLVMLVSMAIVGTITSNAINVKNDSDIYFDNSVTRFTDGQIYFIIWHDKDNGYGRAVKMNKVTNTNNLYYLDYEGGDWTDAWYYGVAQCSSQWNDGSWGTNNYENNSIKHINKIGGENTDINANTTHLITGGTLSSGTEYNRTYCKIYDNNESTGYYGYMSDNLKSTQNVQTKVYNYSTGNYDTLNDSSVATVDIAGRQMSAYNSAETTGSAGMGASASYNTVKTSNVTLSYSIVDNSYEFVGWYNSSGSEVGNESTYSYSADVNNTTYYAYFKLSETKHDVDVVAGSNGKVSVNGGTAATVTQTVNVGTYTTATLNAVPDAGYSFKNWTVTSGVTGVVDGASTTPITIGADADGGTITANFTEKDIKTINVDVDDHASVTVTGSSVSGQDQTFTSDGSFTAHVDDVISFSGAGNPSSGYSIDTLTYSADGGTTPSTNTSFTVLSTGNYVITATSKVKSGYSFYVSAGTGANATVTVQGQNAVTVSAGNRQKIYVEDDTKTFTISAAAASDSYNTPTVTRITSAIDKAGTTVTSADAQTNALADGATYYVATSEKGTESSAYINLSPNDTGSWNVLGKALYKTVSGTPHYYTTIPKSNFSGTSNLFVGISNNSYSDKRTSEVDFWNNGGSDKSTASVASSSADYLSASAQENNGEHFARVNFKSASDASKYDVLVDITQSGTNINYEFSIDSGSGGDITAFDTYYLGGRFRIKDSDSGQIVFTDTTEGSWQTYSVRMPFTKTSGTTYKLETNQTIAQLSAQLDSKSPYFVVHDKKDVFHTSGNEVGLNFENQISSAKALELTKDGSLTYQNEMLFSDDENNSDGRVTIYFDSSNKHIWYEVEDETAAVGNVTLTAKFNNDAIAETTSGNEVTLEATIADKHANAGTMTYTFYNATTNEKIGEVTTSENTASIPYTETHVCTDTFKVVVSSDGVDSTGIGNKLRDGIAKTNVKFKNKSLYRTIENLNGDIAVLCNDTKWDSNPMTDGQEYTFDLLDLSQHQTYEFALATALPANTNDPEALQGNIPEDFYIDEALSKYCDIEYYTLTVSYQNGDDTEQYVVRTYKVTPRTNCANPTVHINTEAIAVKQPNGETKYYPGSIYAVATYTPGKTNTKTEEETVTYYFAEAVGDENQSVSGDGMAIAYWNNSLDNIRKNNEGKNTQVAEIKKLDTYTAVSTPVNVDGRNTIYVDMSKLYEAKESTASKQFKIYSVDLPIWATSFAFIKTATKGSDVIDTTSWNEGTAYGYSSLLLNPNRVYLLYKNGSNWYSRGCCT